jgi:hypothetical protein
LENKDLLSIISEDSSALEKLIFQSLEAYKFKKKSGSEFILKKSLDDTKLVLEKHSNPLNFLISSLFVGFDVFCVDKVYVDDLKVVLKKIANHEGVELSYNSSGDIDGRLILKAIKSCFDLLDFESENGSYGTKVDYNESKRYYPYLRKNDDLWDSLI